MLFKHRLLVKVLLDDFSAVWEVQFWRRSSEAHMIAACSQEVQSVCQGMGVAVRGLTSQQSMNVSGN